MQSIDAISELPGNETAHQFIGADHGEVPVSFFLVHSSPGDGPRLHRHPYAEVFIVGGGEATFVVGESQIVAGAGRILVVPAGVPHGFTNTGTGELRLTAIHPVSELETEWLDYDRARAFDHSAL